VSSSLLSAFLHARYTVWLPRGPTSLVIGAPCVALESVAARTTPFALLTAWNPGGVAMKQATNERAQRRLRDALAALGLVRPGLHCFEGRNEDEGGGWREPSVLALDLDHAAADRLAQRFGQAAILAGAVGSPVWLRWFAALPSDVGGVDTRFVKSVASPPVPDRPS
jgi:hypothetical protein